MIYFNENIFYIFLFPSSLYDTKNLPSLSQLRICICYEEFLLGRSLNSVFSNVLHDCKSKSIQMIIPPIDSDLYSVPENCRHAASENNKNILLLDLIKFISSMNFP